MHGGELNQVYLWMKIRNLWTRISILSCSFILICLLVGCQTNNQSADNPLEVKVARVVNGQRLEVLGLGEEPNFISQVQLIGVDAPDLHQYPWGEDAKKFLETLLPDSDQSVKLEFDIESKDKSGRTLAYVWKNHLLLNAEVIKFGYALFEARSPNHKYDQLLERAQQWGRLMGQGIWNSEKPMRLTPGEFIRLNQ